MREETRNALLNKWLLLAALLAFGVMINPCLEYIMEDGEGRAALDYLYYMTHVESFSGLQPFAILFCMLPYAASFFDERKSGYLKYALLRAPRRRYIAGKMLSVSAGGAAALAGPYLAVAAIGVALFPTPTAQSMKMYMPYYESSLWEPIILNWGPMWVPVLKTALMALFGAVWALPALLASCFFDHRLAVFVVPLVVYQAIWSLFGSPLWFPMEYMMAREIAIPSLWHVLLWQGLYLAALSTLTALSMDWRCRHG